MIYLLTPPVCFLILLWLYMAHASGHIAKEAGRLSKFGLYTGYYPITFVGFLWDVYVNLVWASLIFLDVPKEWTLTQRVERLKHANGKRGQLARWLCYQLNQILPGHCK